MSSLAGSERENKRRYDLRDLSQQIRATAREHPAYWQVSTFITVCCDAIDSVAQGIEQRAELERLRKAAK